jgi:nitrogen fixation protein FixH
MTLTETLFGGLLFAVLLFFASRRLGLSNFWAGILAGALPFVIYLIYSSRHWAGGDVLAIHFVVYLATAGVLIVFGGMQEKKQKIHWAPRLIFFFFIGLVILNATMLTIANRGLPDIISGWLLPHPTQQTIHTGFPGVIPHEENTLYEPHQKQVEQQRQLAWKVSLDGLNSLRSQMPAKITVTVLDAENKPVSSAHVTLGFLRMADSRDDHKLVLNETEYGRYVGTATIPDAGRWLSELHIVRKSAGKEETHDERQSLFVNH